MEHSSNKQKNDLPKKKRSIPLWLTLPGTIFLTAFVTYAVMSFNDSEATESEVSSKTEVASKTDTVTEQLETTDSESIPDEDTLNEEMESEIIEIPFNPDVFEDIFGLEEDISRYHDSATSYFPDDQMILDIQSIIDMLDEQLGYIAEYETDNPTIEQYRRTSSYVAGELLMHYEDLKLSSLGELDSFVHELSPDVDESRKWIKERADLYRYVPEVDSSQTQMASAIIEIPFDPGIFEDIVGLEQKITKDQGVNYSPNDQMILDVQSIIDTLDEQSSYITEYETDDPVTEGYRRMCSYVAEELLMHYEDVKRFMLGDLDVSIYEPMSDVEESREWIKERSDLYRFVPKN